MGKRSRKRTGPSGPVGRSGGGTAGWQADPAAGTRAARAAQTASKPLAAVPGRADRRARKQEAPQAPWAPLPLGELAILVGLVCILVGFFLGGDRAGGLLIAGFGLVTVAGVELALREHLAGYRSHSALLAGATAIVLILPLFFLTPLPYEVLLILGAVFFAAGFQGLRGVFTRRTGVGFRA